MKQLVVTIALLYFGNSLANAQILNIEKSRLNNDSIQHLVGNIAAQFNVQRRTTVVLSGQMNTNYNYTTKKHSFIGIGNWHLVKAEGADLVSDGYAHLRANWLRKQKVSFETFAQAQYDIIRGMEHRYLLGGNVRLNLDCSDKTTILIGLGGMMEWEHWLYEGVIVPSNYFKINCYLNLHKQFNNIVDFNVGGYYQARPSNLLAPRITGDSHLNVKVTTKLSFVTKLSLIYDAAPVVPIDRIAYTWQNGIRYSF